jgi:hypothetical protein
MCQKEIYQVSHHCSKLMTSPGTRQYQFTIDDTLQTEQSVEGKWKDLKAVSTYTIEHAKKLYMDNSLFSDGTIQSETILIFKILFLRINLLLFIWSGPDSS